MAPILPFKRTVSLTDETSVATSKNLSSGFIACGDDIRPAQRSYCNRATVFALDKSISSHTHFVHCAYDITLSS